MAMVMKMVLAMIMTMAMMILMRILCGSLAFLFQSEIFDIVGQSSLDSYLEGYNATVFAYGQTGAGKTFTMQGNLRTMVQNSQGSGSKYWGNRSSIRSFARTTHSFACSALPALLTRSTALIRSLARSITPKLVGNKII